MLDKNELFGLIDKLTKEELNDIMISTLKESGISYREEPGKVEFTAMFESAKQTGQN